MCRFRFHGLLTESMRGKSSNSKGYPLSRKTCTIDSSALAAAVSSIPTIHCCTCKETKPPSEFSAYWHSRASGRCRRCSSAYMKRHFAAIKQDPQKYRRHLDGNRDRHQAHRVKHVRPEGQTNQAFGEQIELYAQAWLSGYGLDVIRAAKRSSKWDLLSIIPGGSAVQVEVRAARSLYDQPQVRRTLHSAGIDALVAVMPDKSIFVYCYSDAGVSLCSYLDEHAELTE